MNTKLTNSPIDRFTRVAQHCFAAERNVGLRPVRLGRRYVEVKHLKRLAAWKLVYDKREAEYRRAIGEA